MCATPAHTICISCSLSPPGAVPRAPQQQQQLRAQRLLPRPRRSNGQRCCWTRAAAAGGRTRGARPRCPRARPAGSSWPSGTHQAARPCATATASWRQTPRTGLSQWCTVRGESGVWRVEWGVLGSGSLKRGRCGGIGRRVRPWRPSHIQANQPVNISSCPSHPWQSWISQPYYSLHPPSGVHDASSSSAGSPSAAARWGGRMRPSSSRCFRPNTVCRRGHMCCAR